MKRLMKVIAGLAVALVIAGILIVMNLGSGIKAAIEEFGPQFVKADVSLDKVDISLTSGEGSLRGLSIGNPAGFRTGPAFNLGEIAVAIDPETVTADTVVINSIRIIAPEITYEMGEGGSNLDRLQKNVEQATGRGGASSREEGAQEGAGKKLIIRDFLISGGKIHYSNPLLGDETVSLALPQIHLTGIGEKSGGATAVEVVDAVISSINKEARGAIGKAGLLKDSLKGAVDDARGRLEKELGGLKGLLK